MMVQEIQRKIQNDVLYMYIPQQNIAWVNLNYEFFYRIFFDKRRVTFPVNQFLSSVKKQKKNRKETFHRPIHVAFPFSFIFYFFLSIGMVLANICIVC